MPLRTLTLAAVLVSLCAAGAAPIARGQAKQPADAPAANDAASADAARKKEILNSPQWRRAMFEFKEWLSAQKIYNAKQVEQLKYDFNHRVARMTSSEVEFMLNDMEAKFKILNTPQAEEARSWMASYLSVMSDKKKAEVLKDLPNVATMTAAQLQAEIEKIERKQATIEGEQAAFNRSRQSEVNYQLQQDRINREEYVNARDSFPTSTGAYSPYRSGASNKQQFSNYRGPQMGYYVNPWGGVGMTFSPSSW